MREKEITLDHVSGKVLVADGFTKQLTGPALGRFKEALGLKGAGKRPIEVKKIEVHQGVEPGFTRGIGLLVAQRVCWEEWKRRLKSRRKPQESGGSSC